MESSAAKRPLDLSSAASAGDRPESTACVTSPSSSAAKRRPPSISSSASFKTPPPPPPKPSAGETLFRLLCPGDRTGGLIGKGGAVVRLLREATGARIRVDDPVPGCDDRVVVVAGDSLRPAAEGEASPAQRALVRVFERILRVEEERNGDAEAGGEEKEIQGTVSCRLLAPSSQVGCVLGKGGKIVEKIRQESGAQVRIFGKEQVPACAAAGDELIHISGSFSAVRKALLSVSSCLQDNSRTESANFAITKSFGTTIRGSGPPPMDPYAQRSYLPNLQGPDYHPRGYSPNTGLDIIPSGQRKLPEEEVLFRILCSNDKVGSIIGKAGVIVRALQSETGASIKVVDPVSDSDERVIVISARENSELTYSPAQDAVLRVHSRLTESGGDRGSSVSATARLLVPVQQIGCLLGKGGSIIAEMRRATGASIRIFLKEQVPKCAQPNDEVVQVTGSFQSVQDALLHITGRIRETIFPLKLHPGGGMAHHIPTASEIPPALLRSRNEPTTPGRYSTVGLSQGVDTSGGLSDTTDRQPPLLYSAERLGVDQGPFSYSSELTGPHPATERHSARSWHPEALNSGKPTGIPDVGSDMGFRSGTLGSGSQTPVVTGMTVEVLVPGQFLGFVNGENGGNLADIKEISGANVTIHDPKPGATEGIVIISGSRDQTQTAQSLLHAFVFCGLELS